MTHPSYLREKCRALRVERRLTIDELAERLALPRTTIYHWVRDLPVEVPRSTRGQRMAAEAVRTAASQARDEAYARGAAEYPALAENPTFRDFICLYVAEGSKRNRNRVAIANSDAAVLRVARRWITSLTDAPLRFSVQYHADQDLEEIRAYWGAQMGTEPAAIALQRKSNSGRLAGRSWRSEHGVLTLWVNDTELRARLQAWIDLLRAEWV